IFKIEYLPNKYYHYDAEHPKIQSDGITFYSCLLLIAFFMRKKGKDTVRQYGGYPGQQGNGRGTYLPAPCAHPCGQEKGQKGQGGYGKPGTGRGTLQWGPIYVLDLWGYRPRGFYQDPGWG